MEHAPAVLACFAAPVSDHGDGFYDQLTDRHSASLAEPKAAGISAFYVLVAENGPALGLFNLDDVEAAAAVSVTGLRSMSPAAAWRPRLSWHCAAWRRLGMGCAYCGRPPPATMWRPRC